MRVLADKIPRVIRTRSLSWQPAYSLCELGSGNHGLKGGRMAGPFGSDGWMREHGDVQRFNGYCATYPHSSLWWPSLPCLLPIVYTNYPALFCCRDEAPGSLGLLFAAALSPRPATCSMEAKSGQYTWDVGRKAVSCLPAWVIIYFIYGSLS